MRLLKFIQTSLAAAVLATAASTAPGIAAPHDVGIHGGAGGGEFRTECRPFDFIAGIDAEVKDGVVISVAPICGDTSPGGPGGTYGSPWAGVPDVEGAERHQVACEPGGVLTGLDVSMNATPLVSRLGFTCWMPDSQVLNDHIKDFGGEEASSKQITCPGGEYGTGIFGRAGTAIDALGLICTPIAELVRPGAPTPPDPTPPPQGKTTVVKLDVDLYDDAGNKKKTADGAPIVVPAGTTVVVGDCNEAGMCHISGGGYEGRVYDGLDYDTL